MALLSEGNTRNNFKQVQNSNIQMDMDYLMHDIGFSADKNTQVDIWEFLDQTITHIPGSGSTDAAIGGQNDTLLDEDSQTAKNMQTVKYNASSKIDTADQLSQLPQTVKYMAGGANRDWFRLAMAAGQGLCRLGKSGGRKEYTGGMERDTSPPAKGWACLQLGI